MEQQRLIMEPDDSQPWIGAAFAGLGDPIAVSALDRACDRARGRASDYGVDPAEWLDRAAPGAPVMPDLVAAISWSCAAREQSAESAPTAPDAPDRRLAIALASTAAAAVVACVGLVLVQQLAISGLERRWSRIDERAGQDLETAVEVGEVFLDATEGRYDPGRQRREAMLARWRRDARDEQIAADWQQVQAIAEQGVLSATYQAATDFLARHGRDRQHNPYTHDATLLVRDSRWFFLRAMLRTADGTPCEGSLYINGSPVISVALPFEGEIPISFDGTDEVYLTCGPERNESDRSVTQEVAFEPRVGEMVVLDETLEPAPDPEPPERRRSDDD